MLFETRVKFNFSQVFENTSYVIVPTHPHKSNQSRLFLPQLPLHPNHFHRHHRLSAHRYLRLVSLRTTTPTASICRQDTVLDVKEAVEDNDNKYVTLPLLTSATSFNSVYSARYSCYRGGKDGTHTKEGAFCSTCARSSIVFSQVPDSSWRGPSTLLETNGTYLTITCPSALDHEIHIPSPRPSGSAFGIWEVLLVTVAVLDVNLIRVIQN